MARLILLGTSNAVPDETHENTHMALIGSDGVVLIDCVSTPKVRLARAGIHLDSITDLILTHFHPDHVSGVPLLLMNMWLMGRQKPLRVYGLHHCLARVEDMMGFYHWENWPEFFPVAFHRLPERERVLVLEKNDFRVFSSPVRHLVPTIGLRIEATDGDGVIAYSCDTEPTPSVVRLASGAAVLFHESSGGSPGHSTAAQAGAIAREAEVARLMLIHYPPDGLDEGALLEQAHTTFQGEIGLAKDFQEFVI
ncbi:MAG TPA: MBL fold metallo-hydrolase [Anaerolineales bacterium]|nr:MBL fold metallo-hydrolase [Anaerolineales bacterium]